MRNWNWLDKSSSFTKDIFFMVLHWKQKRWSIASNVVTHAIELLRTIWQCCAMSITSWKKVQIGFEPDTSLMKPERKQTHFVLQHPSPVDVPLMKYQKKNDENLKCSHSRWKVKFSIQHSISPNIDDRHVII